jgi:hypothetical protein
MGGIASVIPIPAEDIVADHRRWELYISFISISHTSTTGPASPGPIMRKTVSRALAIITIVFFQLSEGTFSQ